MTLDTILIHVYAGLVCFLLGSFYNVVAIRLLEGTSFVYPPSHCPKCQHRLSVRDLIPVFSWVFLKGKCRYCKTSISPLYPIGELVSGLILYALYWKVGWSWELLPAFLLGSALLLATWTDIREKLILDKITFPFLGALMVARFFIREAPYWEYIVGCLVMIVLLTVVSVVSKEGLGGGDIKLFGVVGMALGLEGAILSMFFASAVGVIVSLPYVMKRGRKTEIPFAPFILIGSLIVYFFSSLFPLY